MSPRVLDPVGLLEACDDPRLLAFPAWPRQRELLSAIERSQLVVACCGRRGGKSSCAALACLWSCLFRPQLRERLRPREQGFAVAVATNQRQSRLIIRLALGIVEESPVLRDMVASATDDEIAFANGMTMSALPCTARGTRGMPVHLLVMDEAAHFVDTEGNAAAESVWQALSPSVSQFGSEARIVIASTPYGSTGWFPEMYARAESGELAQAEAFRASSAEMNPTLDQDFLRREELRDPETFRGEYLAEFVGSGGAFLNPERIEDALVERDELAPEQATGWIAGLDPAFSSDPFGLALVGRDHADGRRLVLGRAQAWRPEKSKLRRLVGFEQRREREDAVLAEVGELCRRFKARVFTDQYAAPSVVARLQQSGLSVQTVAMTAASKTEVFLELRARLNAGTLELYDDAQLLAELRRLRTKYSAGSSQVVNPRVGGSHGDLAQALALAVWAHRGAQGGALPPLRPPAAWERSLSAGIQERVF